MASRSAVDRIARKIAAIEAASAGILYVPVYPGESEVAALALYIDECSIPPSSHSPVAYNHIRQGETREQAIASGTHLIHSIGPDSFLELLAQVDGRTRGIPTAP
jgi:hypothetical protein